MSARGLSLSVKVGIAVLAVSAIPAAVATAVAYSQSRELLRQSIGDNLAAQADRLTDELDSFHSSFIVRAASLAGFETVTLSAGGTEDDRRRAREMFETVVLKDPRIHAVSLVAADGQVTLSSNRAVEGTSVSGRAWFVDRQSDTVTAALSVPPGADMSGAVLDYSAPLRDGGFVLVSVRAEAFWQLVRQLNDRVFRGSYVVVLNRNGIRYAHGSLPSLIFHPAGELEASKQQELVASQAFGARTREFVTPVAEPQEFTWATAATGGDRSLQRMGNNSLDQGERFATSRRLTSVPWTVVSVVPAAALTAPVQELLTGIGWRIGVVLVLAFVVSFFVAQRGLEPVTRLVDAAGQLAQGKTPPQVQHAASDELGELVRQFNAMVVSTANARAELEARVKERTRELTTANEELLVQQEELRAQQDELERKNREVERANQLKSAFLANMSHELRTPLNSVIGFSELLNDDLGGTLDARHRKYLHDVNASGKHLLRLINDILDLSKIEAGHLDLEVEALSAGELVAQARSLVGGPALAARVTVIEEVRTRQRVLADPEKLRQVLVNLLSNAVKFSPAGSEVRVGVDEVHGGVRFSVRDNGPGIDPSYMKRLFEPFVQGENPLTKRHQGTGLGLAISRRVIERHGSTLHVESEPGRGAHFWFVLPATMGEAPAQAPVERAQIEPLVLLVEAEPARARLLREALQDAQFVVAAPIEGEQVQAAVERLAPAVVVLSPSEDAAGLAALKALKTNSGVRDTPVVLTSAPHASGILGKPLDADEVVAAVRKVAGKAGPVLVVDDDPRALELLTAILTPRGYTVQTANGATEALARMRLEKPAAVLTDLLMPEVSGFDFVDALAADAKLRDVPVLVLTALELDEEQRRRLRKHVVAMARKGDVTAHEVVEAVSRLTRPQAPSKTPATNEKTVLVVDDHDLNRQLARALLEKRGYAVLEATNGHEAVAMARQHAPALILMDLAMPELDGFGALVALREQSSTAKIPVVALTAMAMKSDEEAVNRAGFNGYLTKPVDAARLDEALRRVLQGA